MVTSPAIAYRTGDLIRECFAKLGSWIKSCHAKDVALREALTVHRDECVPGTGVPDYETYLKELAKLDGDVTLMIEHLPEEAYPRAAEHISSVARRVGEELL